LKYKDIDVIMNENEDPNKQMTENNKPANAPTTDTNKTPETTVII